MTLDGKTATKTGFSKWISNEQSREIVHQLRGRVDAIMIGPDDLSQDMGIPGALEHPDLLAVIDQIFETCKAAGTPCGLTSHTVDKATHWLGKGAQWLPYSNDAAMVFNAANAALPALKKAAGR